MATHLVAWFENLAAGITDAEINGVQDDILTRPTAERFTVPPEYNNIAWAYAQAATLGRSRLVTPSLEVRRSTPFILPHNRGALPSLASPEIFMPRKPIQLIPDEELSVRVTDAALEDVFALALLQPAQLPPVPAGDIRRVRCTGTTVLVDSAWTSVVLTPDTQIEAGEYALVGFVAFSANAIAARALIQGQAWRPGVIAVNGASEAVALEYNRGFEPFMGGYEMGRFPHNVLPQIQFLASAADVAETVYLDIVKVG